MKFDEALDRAWNKTPSELRPQGDRNYPKLLAMMWSMLAEAQNVLDDTVYISNDMIVSTPLETGKDKKPSKKKASSKKEKGSDEERKEPAAESEQDETVTDGEEEENDTTDNEPEEPKE